MTTDNVIKGRKKYTLNTEKAKREKNPDTRCKDESHADTTRNCRGGWTKRLLSN